MNLFDQIRSACAKVAGLAGYVRIDEDRLPAYARSLEIGRDSPSLDPDAHFMGQEEETLAYFLTLDSINFGSGYFPHLVKPEGRSGYFTIAAALKRRFKSQGPLSAAELAGITTGDCAEMLEQPADSGPREELMGLFGLALNMLGLLLDDRFDGSFVNMVEEAGRSAEKLAGILSTMPFFNDVSRYRGLEVPFYKRAQITAADLGMAFHGKGFGEFADLGMLTIFADNLVPHVLKIDGVLRFDPDLDGRIGRGELIASGSEEEVEIRACALHAVELMAAHLRSCGSEVDSAAIDSLLWNRGQGREYKARPRHRTRCVYY